MDILLTGSVAFDYLMTFPGLFAEQILPERLTSISLSFLVDSMSKVRGGVAPNIGYTMALLGERPQVMATVGEDFSEYRVWLESRGVDTSRVQVIPGEFTNLPISQYPPIAPPSIAVDAFYAGASAETVENSVVQSIEQKMTGFDKMLYMTASSDASGAGRVELTSPRGPSPARSASP